MKLILIVLSIGYCRTLSILKQSSDTWTYSTTVSNDGNSLYTIPLFFGTPSQNNPSPSFIIDTTNSYTTVFST